MPPFSRLRLVDVVLFLGAISWASTYLLGKELLSDPAYSPIVVAARMLLSAAALALFVLLLRRGRPTRVEWRSGMLLGLPLSVIFALETYGIALTSATNAGVLISLNIVFVPFVESAVRRTRLKPAFVGLCLAAVVGAFLLASGNGFTAPSLGDLLILGAALVRTIHVTTSSVLQAREELDPYRLTAIQLGAVGVAFAVLCPIVNAPVGDFVAGLTPARLAILLYLAVIAGAAVFAVQTWGIAKTSAAHASLLLGTEPVWAAIFGVVIGGDQLGPLGIAGIVITLAAVLAAQRLSVQAAAEGDQVNLEVGPADSFDPGRGDSPELELVKPT